MKNEVSKHGRDAWRAYEQASRAARYIRSRIRLRPQIAVVLGSGLGMIAERLAEPVRMEYRRIPYFPVPGAAAHAGRLVIGRIAGVPVVAMQGRPHLYEGFSPQQVIFPVRVLRLLGVRAVILTNAAGGISRRRRKGSLVLLSDHINLQGVNPLAGPNEARFGVRFPELTRGYWPRYRTFARREAKKLGLKIFEGVYAAMPGPSYETPAEIRFLRRIGADLVGMSTVPEAIAAAHLGIRVLAISCVTNRAAAAGGQVITAEEVLETGARVQEKLGALLAAVIPRIAGDLDESPEPTRGR